MKAWRLLWPLLAVLCILAALCSTAYAQDDTGIVIHYDPGQCTFDFYKIADFSTETGLSLTDTFAAYTGSVTGLERLGELDTEGTRILSATLEAVIQRDGLKPTYTARSDEEGTLVLDHPDQGVYLILGERTADEHFYYTPSPILISIPNRDGEGAWQYTVTVEHNKFQKEEKGDKVTRYRVRKIWLDDGYTARRPAAIVVQLLRDGALYDRVSLSVENDWTHQWNDLPADSTWIAVEETVPEGYTLSVEKEACGIALTNTYKKPPPPPPQLPPTGQLWWPVPLLALVGVCSLILGCAPAKRSSER